MINLTTLRSWEFLLLVLTNVAAWLATTGSTVTTHNAYLFTALSAMVYALARGLAKVNSDGKPIYLCTELYVAVIGALVAFLGAMQGHISDTLLKELLAGLAAASAIANGLRAPNAPGNPPAGV